VKTAKVERPIIVVTNHNQSDPPTVRRRAARDGLTWIGLTIWYVEIGSIGSLVALYRPSRRNV
jgi:hypothetical protein